MSKSKMDLICGISFLAVSAAFYFQTGELESKSLIFPMALIVIIALGGIWFVIKGLLGMNKLADAQHEHIAWKKVGLISLASVFYALCIVSLGFFASTFLFIIIAYIQLGDASKGRMRQMLAGCAYGICFSFLIWLCFVKLLNVPVPSGLLF